MKKIKQIVILLFMCFILSGCDVTYNLNIDGDKLSEDVTIRYNDSTLTYDYVNSQFPNLPIDYQKVIDDDDMNNLDKNTILYNRKLTSFNGGYLINYNYNNFNRITINKSNVAKHAFNFFQYVLTYDENNKPGSPKIGTIEVVTNNVMNVFETNGILQNVTVNITTNRKVLEHNANVVNGNTYTWYYNRNDYKKSISLKMYYEEEKNTTTNNNDVETDKDDDSSTESKKDEEIKKDNEKNGEDKKSTSQIIVALVFLLFIVVLVFVMSLKK